MVFDTLHGETVSPDEFIAQIKAPEFPCVGAKSAAARGNLKIVRARDITSGWNDLDIHRELLNWADEYDGKDSNLRSLVVLFDGPTTLSETAFEKAMWERLQSFAAKDAWLGEDFASSVSADPDDPHFSVSFGGEAYFVVGLHPRASRPARRFAAPAMVFNLHDQFEKLRAQGRYDRMRETIIERDIAIAGTINPMLAQHGEVSAARQFSGRAVGDDWKCPFQDPRA
ncbi:guanitoxin biosynthesis heme-dependent pre-guanitoxin N-hydroxylase GntA [Qipengyuania marisflavi]|uniref:YqcI/YcgG family protein n=1 Tax=Qipengyuania marisflavi TaxID=2486356 RepID=A0A5S3Q0K8_9SPHN|nr:guanitoxin biosynthesis heme-dependent pre-guanitoxin N-hydroxylase GntA [Qipengyuania marisflavi]TMM49867.1 YqcI/YcgG family protein [Qipengyuania marisflavi]